MTNENISFAHMLKRLLAGALIFIFVGLTIDKVSQWHSHVSSDGIVYQHAHPYSHSKGHEHSHSKNQLSFLVLINGFIDDDTQYFVVPEAIEQEASTAFVWNYIYSFIHEKLLSNKSPPFSELIK
jgi:hypothetical protein